MASTAQGGTRPAWSGSDVLRAAAIVLALWFALRFLWIVRSIAIASFLGMLLGIVIAAGTNRLERLKIRRGLGATLILLTGIGAFVAAGIALAPTLREQFSELRDRLPTVLDQVAPVLGVRPEELISEGLDAAGGEEGAEDQEAAEGSAPAEEREPPPPEESEEEASPLRKLVARHFGEIGRVLFPVASATAGIITMIVLILFIGLFYAIAPDFYFRGLLHLIPATRRDRAREVMEEMGQVLRQWLIARMLAMATIGVIVAITLAIAGVRAAILLGLVAGLFELIPIFGPILAAVPAIGMALLDSPQKALIVLIAFVVIQQLEGNLLTPLLLQNRADVPPLLTVVGVVALTVVLGFTGAIIAEPAIAAALVLVRRLWIEDVADKS